jgi:GNAT superfamily N-acetyltransferase
MGGPGGAGGFVVRQAEAAAVSDVLALLDGAVRWLVAQGRPGQWGTEPLSAEPRHRTRISGWAADQGLYLACLEGQTVGALAVGRAPGYAPVAAEPELYINLLVTDRAYAGRGVGRLLLEHARRLGRERGVTLLRVDCYAGDDRALVRYYERAGFRPVSPFSVELTDGRRWPGQLLEQRLGQAAGTNSDTGQENK